MSKVKGSFLSEEPRPPLCVTENLSKHLKFSGTHTEFTIKSLHSWF